jgi:histidine phosphotransferase ChpT
MDIQDSLKFNELLIAKLCHDLAGNISAISHAAEFINEGNIVMQEKAIELLNKSSSDIMAKLRYFRYAYGVSSENYVDASASLKAISADYFTRDNITLLWDDNLQLISPSMAKKACKLVANILPITANQIIHGGDLSVQVEILDNSLQINITAENNKYKPLKISQNKEQLDYLDVYTIQKHLLKRYAEVYGARLHFKESPTKYTITAHLFF